MYHILQYYLSILAIREQNYSNILIITTHSKKVLKIENRDWTSVYNSRKHDQFLSHYFNNKFVKLSLQLKINFVDKNMS